HGRRMLIVLDNARTPEQVRPLLPGSSSCLVLVSSRDRLDDLVAREGARLYALDVLGQIDAGDLLSHMAGDHRIEPAAADRIAAPLLGGPEQEAENLLDQLVRAGLLEVAGRDRAGQARYRLHDLMRLYARERGLAADSSADRDAAAARFFGTALYLAEQ